MMTLVIGYERCLRLLKANYFFPAMGRAVRKYVGACISCAFAKGNYGKKEGFLNSIEKRSIPMDTIHIDHVGPFSKSTRGNSYLLVIVDAFSKFVVAKPSRSLRSGEVIDHLKEVFGTFGVPRRIVSDRGLAFTSKQFKQLCATRA